jgi:hypothetical protein
MHVKLVIINYLIIIFDLHFIIIKFLVHQNKLIKLKIKLILQMNKECNMQFYIN